MSAAQRCDRDSLRVAASIRPRAGLPLATLLGFFWGLGLGFRV